MSGNVVRDQRGTSPVRGSTGSPRTGETGADGTPALIADTAAALRSARERYLASFPVSRIIDALDAAITHWQDSTYPLLREACDLLPGVTGYSRPMLEYGLPRLLASFRRDGLETLVRKEFGSVEALDAVLAVRPSLREASGQAIGSGRTGLRPSLTYISLAGNIPAVTAESIVHALLVKSACLVKASSRDPIFPALFARSLAEADRNLGQCVAVLRWKGGAEVLNAAAVREADAVIAYGRQGHIDALRHLARPGVPFLAYGPRISFAAIARESLTRDALSTLAEHAAYDVSLFDQQGCVAPHAIYVESEPNPYAFPEREGVRFAEALAMAMTTFERRLPRGRISTGDASRIQQQRGGWAMRQAAGQPVRLFQSERSTTWTVAYDEEAFAFQPSPLNRVVTVIPIDTLERLPEAIAPMRPYLQTIGLAAPDKRLAALTRLLMATGVTRVCPLGEMQHPPADWPHDGRPNLLPLLGK